MNFLLQINKKIIIFVLAILILYSVWLLIIKPNLYKKNISKQNDYISNFDILNPKFTIDNNENSITISANEGNFINENKILLKNKVSFVSKKFKIESSEVFFDKTKQTAHTKSGSIFSAEGTNIISEGFEIKEGGNKIIFSGKTTLNISK